MANPREPIPPLSRLFGYGPVLRIVAAAFGGWALPADWQVAAVGAGWLWATAVLLFLAGVTRGLSFFSPRGPHRAQIVQTLWLFALGIGALATPPWIGLALLVLGYGSVAAFDPPAARHGLAPAYFARLRPPQMAIALIGLLLLLLLALQL